MMHSVWNHDRRRYDYYQSNETQKSVHPPSPTHIPSGTQLGVTPEEAAWPLPGNARYVGSGKYAKGRISSRSSGLGALGIIPDLSPVNIVLLGALGWMLYEYIWKPARKSR